MATRRQFLGTVVGGAAALWGARASAMTPVLSPRVFPQTPVAPERSKVAVVRTAAYPDVRAALRRAVELHGGLAFVQPGDEVLIKPAVNSARPYPATSDPVTVLAVAELIRERGGKPLIADRTMFARATAPAFERTGLAAAAKEARIPLYALDDEPVVALWHPLASHWSSKRVPVYRLFAEVPHVVNLCTPRAHKLAGYTMAVKNMVGVVSASARSGMHLPLSFHDRLGELPLVTRSSLVVLDGRQGFADGGPDQGRQVAPGFLAVGEDPLAVDAVGLAGLRRHRANAQLARGSVWELPVMRRAVQLGVGIGDGTALELLGLDEADETALREALGRPPA